MEKKKLKDLTYEFVLFKIKGHETWRLNNVASMKDINPDIITEQKKMVVDRITGEVTVK